MDNNDNQEITIESTLPQTEQFGLINCMVKPGSIVDNIKDRTRKFKVTPFYDDTIIVGIGNSPITYKVSDTGEILNCIFSLGEFTTKTIHSNSIPDGEVVLDVTMTKPDTIEDGLISYSSGVSEIIYNKNAMSETTPTIAGFMLAKARDENDLFTTNHMKLTAGFIYLDGGSPLTSQELENIRNKCSLVYDIVINDEYITTAHNHCNVLRRMSGAPIGVNLKCSLSYDHKLPNDVFNATAPLRVKLVKRNKDALCENRTVGISYDPDYSPVFPNIFKSTVVKSGNITQTFSTKMVKLITPDSDDDIEVSLFFKDGINANDVDIKYITIPIMRFNASNDINMSPENNMTSETDVNSVTYHIALQHRMNEKCIQFTIPNKLIKSINFPTQSDISSIIIGCIKKSGGEFTNVNPKP